MSDESMPNAMRATYEAVVALTDAVCAAHLNDEYARLSRRMAVALSRKMPSPMAGGHAAPWAAAIVYALGQINYLFSTSTKAEVPHLTPDELAAFFGVKKANAAAKANRIREILAIQVLDHRWMLAPLVAEGDEVWMVSMGGRMVDARTLPPALQKEAHRKGLIPYVPGDRGQKS